MKRNLAVAVLSIFSLAIPQFASAGQAGNYGGYYQNDYGNDGRYHRTAPNDYDRHYDRDNYYRNGYYDNRGYYGNDRYDDRCDDERNHHRGRATAIIGGSTLAGAVLGGAAGHGRGAAIGAVVGGVAGVVADQAVRHHDRDRW